MNKILILNTILEESEDYLPMIESLSPKFDIAFVHFVDGYTQYEGVRHIKMDSLSTSKAWNHVFRLAKEEEYTHLAILNHVKFITPEIFDISLENNESLDVINLSDGGAFIVNCSSDFNANEEYNLWFADNEILNNARDNDSYFIFREEDIVIEQTQNTSIEELINAAIEADLELNSSK
jgi:hypothetical protein